ncbi:MAG: homoserine kinase [Alphaproteobacteria bacterium]|nr:homoserine kinase [Alphaproteobacteria bacterium]
MAVYTEVTDDEVRAFVAEYDIGEVVSYQGIAEGVENSNFLLRTTRGSYILTLYEKRVRGEDLPFFLGLMEHLAKDGIACPTPLHGRDGPSLRRLCGRPAAIVTFLEGMWPRRIQPLHCAELGDAMARLHLAARGFPLARSNDLSLAGWRALLDATAAKAHSVQPGLAEELGRELASLEKSWPKGLPTGVIHADLFPDNVFFLDSKLSGLIDFYFACNDLLAYDLAIGLNAWCFEPDLSFNITKARLMLQAYRRRRPLEPGELEALPILARGSALRFLLTRLYDWLFQPPGAFVRRKDPLEYLAKLRFHRRIAGPTAYGLD